MVHPRTAIRLVQGQLWFNFVFIFIIFIVLVIFTLSIRPGIFLGIPETFVLSGDGLLHGVDVAKEPSTSLQ